MRLDLPMSFLEEVSIFQVPTAKKEENRCFAFWNFRKHNKQHSTSYQPVATPVSSQ